MVNVVHLNRVSDLFFVEFGAATEDVDVLVVEDAAGCRVTGNIQVSDSTPGVILDVVLLARRVEALCIVATNDKDETALTVQGSEVRALEK